jgi:hypothetical protein
VLELAAAFRLNIAHGRVWLALGGVASIVLGVLMFIAPVTGAIVLTWWLGAYALVFGSTLLVLAFRLRAGTCTTRRRLVRTRSREVAALGGRLRASRVRSAH